MAAARPFRSFFPLAVFHRLRLESLFFLFLEADVTNLAAWPLFFFPEVEVPFKPARFLSFCRACRPGLHFFWGRQTKRFFPFFSNKSAAGRFFRIFPFSPSTWSSHATVSPFLFILSTILSVGAARRRHRAPVPPPRRPRAPGSSPSPLLFKGAGSAGLGPCEPLSFPMLIRGRRVRSERFLSPTWCDSHADPCSLFSSWPGVSG